MKHSFQNVRTTYSIAWEYTLLIQVMVEISNFFKNNSNIKTNRENAKIITDFLVKKNYFEESKSIKVFFDYLHKIVDAKVKVNFKVVEVEANIKAREAEEKKLINLLHFNDITSQKRALKEILQSYPVYIFLDELDTGWDNSDEAKNYIDGLFSAVYSLSSIQNFNIFVSLRQDMYNNLIESLTNAEKIREDIEKLYWDKRFLNAVIAKRVLSCLSETERIGLSNDDIINSVFEEGVLDYIIEYTLKRPREVIELCNKSQEEYINLYRIDFNSQRKITEDIVNTVLSDFSNNRIFDICKEYQYEFPKIKEILFAFENGNEYYDKQTFISIIDDGILSLIEKYGEIDWIKEIDFDSIQVMEILFRIGFIKIFVPKDNEYLAIYETTILDFDKISKVKINNVFVSALRCR
jgi:hypothetical protein